MKKPRYTMVDVERWEKVGQGRISLFIPRLQSGGTDARMRRLDFGGVAGLSFSQAQSCVARELYPRALGWLTVAVEAEIHYIVCLQQEGFLPAAGHWQSLLHAHTSTDKSLIDRYSLKFDLELAAKPEADSTKDSMYHARLLKSLTELRIDDTKTILAEKRPSPEAMFRGYYKVMEMIALNDESGFAEAIGEASVSWEKYARRCWKGLPDAVCFMNGVGFIRLAEHVWKHPVSVDDPNIPPGLLGDVTPETVDIGL